MNTCCNGNCQQGRHCLNSPKGQAENGPVSYFLAGMFCTSIGVLLVAVWGHLAS